MKQNTLCPISDKKINERVARTNATLTVLFLISFFLTQNVLLIVFLAIDFLLRASPYSNYSLIAISSKNIVKYFAFNEYFINAGPKILAARIGLVLTSLMIVTYILQINWLSYSLAGILGLFSALEGVFGICVACEIYPYLFRYIYNQKYNG